MFSSTSTFDNAGQNARQELRELPVASIEPNPSQPRRHFDEEALHALAGSIGERGVLQPVLVRPREDGRYELVAGERRWRAAQLAGLGTIPALVSRYDELAALEAALIENMARKDLSPVEEGRACDMLGKEFGLTYRQVGALVGRQKNMVSNLVRLLKLSDELLELVDRGELSAAHGKALLRAKDPEVRGALARAAIEQGWSVRVLEAHADQCNDAAGVPKLAYMERKGDLEGAAFSLAKAWGDVLGTEVRVGVLPRGQMRLEVVFGSAERGVAMADRLAATIARGAKD